MYEKHFGFKERPFQLVPNPAYLFLSKSHEEALGHLAYAVSQGDGFVEMTGEIGTGKTTLCRVFLENLEDNTEAAYIFNPMMDAVHLLMAINDEFGIPSDSDSIKNLIDILNEYLMEKKAQGKRVLLLIDEAQNLGTAVLEQLRLLSNLETNTSKLLQIILIGQPELREKLDSHELRQLSQRITLSCHLIPLNFNETQDYIRHRIQIASQKPSIILTRSAMKAIYKYSCGTPRLINIACDRAMLTAYGLHKQKITGSIARAAIRELVSRRDLKKYGASIGVQPLLIGSVFLLILFLLIFFGPVKSGFFSLFDSDVSEQQANTTLETDVLPSSQKTDSNQHIAEEQAIKNPVHAYPAADNHVKPENNEPDNHDIKAEPPKPAENISEPPMNTDNGMDAKITPAAISAAPSVEAPLQDDPPAEPDSEKMDDEKLSRQNYQTLDSFLKTSDSIFSRHMALKTVFMLWQPYAIIRESLNKIEDHQTFFRIVAKQNAFSLYQFKGSLNLMGKLNLPAVLKLRLTKDAEPVYLTLTMMGHTEITLRSGDTIITATSDELGRFWDGTAYIPWKNFLGLTGIISRNAADDSIITLKILLQDIGFDSIRINPDFDEQTRQAIKNIQNKHGINVDGSVGPMTKIILYNELPAMTIPHILPVAPSASGREAVN